MIGGTALGSGAVAIAGIVTKVLRVTLGHAGSVQAPNEAFRPKSS
jgi:hypothetical protein